MTYRDARDEINRSTLAHIKQSGGIRRSLERKLEENSKPNVFFAEDSTKLHSVWKDRADHL